MQQFSSHPWPESQTLGPCAALQPPMGTAGHCLCPSGTSRLCSLPSRFKTLQRCSAETKTSGLQGSYFHLPTAQPPAIELRKREKSVLFHSAGLQLLCRLLRGGGRALPILWRLPGVHHCTRAPGRGKPWEHRGAAWSGGSSGCPLSPHASALSPQPNTCLKGHFQHNIYFAFRNLSREPRVIFTIPAILFA